MSWITNQLATIDHADHMRRWHGRRSGADNYFATCYKLQGRRTGKIRYNDGSNNSETSRPGDMK